MACNEQFINIEQEYGKNPNLKREDIKNLRKFVETQYPATSDLQLFLFLHSCYYDTEAVKNTIDSYYKIRSNWPEVFTNRNPNVLPLRDHLPITVTWPLKGCTKEGYRVFYSKLINNDPTQYNLDAQLKLYFVIVEFWLNTLGNSEGVVLVLDAKGLAWGHLPKLGINAARKLVEYVQEAFPVRLKGVHCINTGVIVEKLMTIFIMFMKKELQDIIHIHSDFESLYSYVPKTSLPKDYGGNDVTIQELHEDMMNTMIKNSELFEKDDVYDASKGEKFTYFDAY